MKIIKYGTPWCGPCKLTTKTLAESGQPFEEINLDQNKDILETKGFRSVPVVEFYKEGEDNPTYTHIGLLTKPDLDYILEKYGD